MNYIYAIAAGIVQGLTEFLPISSSGHLVLFHDLLGFDLPDNLTFDVVLHLGTLGALLLYFYKDIAKYARAFFQSLTGWNLKNDLNQRLSWYFAIGTIPAVIIGYFFEDLLEAIFRNATSVATMLIAFGAILYFVDKTAKQQKELKDVSWKNAIIIGAAQAIALIPGVSRSGITIIAGLSQKLKREDAARFSFLLSIPAVAGAGLKKLLELENFNCNETLPYVFGFLAALLSGYLTIKYFLRFLEKNSLAVFACYRIMIGLLILVIIYLVG